MTLAPLAVHRRLLAVAVIAVGLCTAFVPMVVVDPPVLNRTDWSALEIASAVQRSELPVQGGQLDDGLFQIAAIYGLLILALPAVFLPGRPWALLVIATAGLALSSAAKFWDGTFHQTFGYYRHPPSLGMSRGFAWWLLPWIMPALVAICLASRLDAADR